MSLLRKTRVKEIAELQEALDDVVELVDIATHVKAKVQQVRSNILAKIVKSKGTYPVDQLLGDIQKLNEQYRKLFGRDAIKHSEIFETICEAL